VTRDERFPRPPAGVDDHAAAGRDADRAVRRATEGKRGSRCIGGSATTEAATGRAWHAYVESPSPDAWFNGQTDVDR
jgi:hypothetical protein